MPVISPDIANALRWTNALPPTGRTWVDIKNFVALKLAFGQWLYTAPSSLAGKIILPPEVILMEQVYIPIIDRTDLFWSIIPPPDFDENHYSWYFSCAQPLANRLEYTYTGYKAGEDVPSLRNFTFSWPPAWEEGTPTYNVGQQRYKWRAFGFWDTWSLRAGPHITALKHLPIAPPWHRSDYPA